MTAMINDSFARHSDFEIGRQAGERAERLRCIGICRKFPDNLMARCIEKLILEGM